MKQSADLGRHFSVVYCANVFVRVLSKSLFVRLSSPFAQRVFLALALSLHEISHQSCLEFVSQAHCARCKEEYMNQVKFSTGMTICIVTGGEYILFV